MQLVRSAVLLALAASPWVASAAADATLPVTASFAGRSSPRLAAEWWQWAMSADDGENPVRDLTGANCAVGQRGRVWFLAGGVGSSLIRRTCEVPAGKALFFPVINMVYWPRRGHDTFTCERARKAAAVNNETAMDLFAELDGVPVANVKAHRVATTTCFDVLARVPAERGPYKAYPSATDGYWLLLKPLPAGRHRLKFGGRYNRTSAEYGRMLQDIEYELIVK